MSEDTSNTTREATLIQSIQIAAAIEKLQLLVENAEKRGDYTVNVEAYLLAHLIGAWLGGLDKNMHRDEIWTRINEEVCRWNDVEFKNCIERLDMPKADRTDKDFEEGHHNQGFCVVFFKKREYADYLKDLQLYEFVPTEYKKSKYSTQIHQSRAERRWVDVEHPCPEIVKASERFENVPLSKLQEWIPRSKSKIKNLLTTPKEESKKKTGMNAFGTTTKSQPDEPRYDFSRDLGPTLSQMQNNLFLHLNQGPFPTSQSNEETKNDAAPCLTRDAQWACIAHDPSPTIPVPVTTQPLVDAGAVVSEVQLLELQIQMSQRSLQSLLASVSEDDACFDKSYSESKDHQSLKKIVEKCRPAPFTTSAQPSAVCDDKSSSASNEQSDDDSVAQPRDGGIQNDVSKECSREGQH